MRPNCVRALSTLAGLGPLGLAVWFYSVTLPAALGVPPASSHSRTKPATAKTSPAKPRETPTFTRDIAPILQQKCQNCHRKHQVGPFPLETYEQARKRASDIATVAADRRCRRGSPHPGSARAQARSIPHAPGHRHPRSLGRGGGRTGDPKDMPPRPNSPRAGRSARPISSSNPPRTSRSPPTPRTPTDAS